MTIPYYESNHKFRLTENGFFYIILKMMEKEQLDNLIPELTERCNTETGTFAQFNSADICKNAGTGDVAVIAYFSPGMLYPPLLS